MAAVTPGEDRVRLLYRMRAQRLFWRMLGRQGIDAAGSWSHGLEEAINHAVGRCRQCRNVDACKTWLDAPLAPHSSATFCPNESAMEAFRMARPVAHAPRADTSVSAAGLSELLDDLLIRRLMAADHVNAEILRHAMTDKPRFTAACASPVKIPCRKPSAK